MGEATGDGIPATIEWRDGAVRLIDQRRLPGELVFLEVTTVDAALRCHRHPRGPRRARPRRGGRHGDRAGRGGRGAARRSGRPPQGDTADRGQPGMGCRPRPAGRRPVAEALAIAAEDVACNRRLGAHGAILLADGARILTHCNAGALACVGYGTAIGVIRAAHDAGRRPRVWADETRPVLQGARLTSWELQRLGIPVTVVADVMAASLMQGGEVDCVLVGADRVAANGDVANKVGTYGLAVLAAHHGIPFYVAAPLSTIDLCCVDGAAIPVERRPDAEVATFAGHQVTPEGVAVENRAFDVTPATLVSAIITDAGVVRAPYQTTLPALLARSCH